MPTTRPGKYHNKQNTATRLDKIIIDFRPFLLLNFSFCCLCQLIMISKVDDSQTSESDSHNKMTVLEQKQFIKKHSMSRPAEGETW